MKSKSLSLIVAVLTLGLLAAGASPAFAAKGLKAGGKVATTQKSTDGKLHKHHRHHRHQKLTKQEKKAIKHEIKKQLKKQSTTAAKL